MADWSDLIGLDLEAAQKKCVKYDHTLRVSKWNGQPAVHTRDYREDRINVSVDQKRDFIEGPWIVTEVHGRG